MPTIRNSGKVPFGTMLRNVRGTHLFLLLICGGGLLKLMTAGRRSATAITTSESEATKEDRCKMLSQQVSEVQKANLPSQKVAKGNSTDQQSCQHMVDALDSTFDQRRKVRQDIMKTCPDSTDDKEAFDLYEPEAVCISDERFGSADRYAAFGDGPKFICGVDVLAAKAKSKKGCLVYSIGSDNKIEFEVSVDRFMGCETHTFDPTLTEPFIGGKYSEFHPWGLGEDGEEMSFKESKWTAKSLARIVEELGHENRTIDILKIDCEGCEWDVLPPFFDMMASGKFRVDQLLIEVHHQRLIEGGQDPPVADFFLSADKAKLRVFHKERNHWGCEGYKCLEYALVSESFLREANEAAMCPK